MNSINSSPLIFINHGKESKKRFAYLISNIMLGFLLFPNLGHAVSFYILEPAFSSLEIKGDSTLHKWEMTAKHFAAAASITTSKTGLDTIKDLEFKIQSTKISSEHKTMEEKAHQTLKSDKYPYIIFNLDKILEFKKENNHNNTISASGELFIGGVSRKIKVTGQINLKDKKIRIRGSHKLKMSDFNLKLPRVLFIKAKDEVTIVFNLLFTPKDTF